MSRKDKAIPTHPAVLQSVKDKFEALFNDPSEPNIPDEPDFNLDFTPDVILVHNCAYPEIKKCLCKKKVPYLEALKMANRHDADWVRLVTAAGYKIVPALIVRAHSSVRRARVPNSGSAEVVAEIALANKQNRAPDVTGLVEQAEAQQDAAQKRDLIETNGAAVNGMIQSTNKTGISDNGKKLVEESRGTFDESSFPKMTGPPMQYQGKKRVRETDKADKTGHEVADGDELDPNGG